MNNEKGITLIEVLSAVVILSLVVIIYVLLSSFVSGSRTMGDHRSDAVQIAENELNEWKARIDSGDDIRSMNRDYTSGDFEVLVLEPVAFNALAGGSDPYADDLGVIPATRVSMQTIVYSDSVPQLLTVVVYWED